MKFRDVVRRLELDGWVHVRTTGSHMMFRHPTKSGRVVVPGGGKLSKDIKEGTLKSILRQAGIELR